MGSCAQLEELALPRIMHISSIIIGEKVDMTTDVPWMQVGT